MYTVYLEDSLKTMKNMADGSIDMVITSPPYADARKKTYGGVRVDEYVDWFLDYSAEIYRILKDDGSFILNIKEKVVDGERHTYVMELVIAMRQQGWKFTEEYMWHKTTTTPGKWPNRFRDLWEHCFHFTKSKKFVMNQDDVKVPIGEWSKKRLKDLSEKDIQRNTSDTGSGYGRNVSNWVGKDMVYPGNVLHGASETGNTGHSAAFPIWLPEWFIKLFSNSGETIYDPFMGSGSTAIAALNLDRDVIGSELLEKYVTLSCERVLKKHPNKKVKVVENDIVKEITIPRNSISEERTLEDVFGDFTSN